MNTLLPFNFHVQISLFAKGKVLNGEGSGSPEALEFHTVAHSRLKKEGRRTGETVVDLFATVEAEMK